MSFATSERRDLAALLLRVGPDAPTLCDGWTTKDLATHLYLRENRPDAMAGMVISRLAEHTKKVTQMLNQQMSYEEIVTAWGKGPGRWSPFRLIDSAGNTLENFIHHEDVRRAQPEWTARVLTPKAQAELAAAVARMAPIILRRSHLAVILEPEGLPPIVVSRKKVAEAGDAVVRVRGVIGEIALWLFSRDKSTVTIIGDADAAVRTVI